MIASEHLKQLQKLRSSQPFTRFRVTTRKGEVFQVNDRLQYGFTDNRFMFAVPREDRLVEIPVSEIESVQSVEVTKPAA